MLKADDGTIWHVAHHKTPHSVMLDHNFGPFARANVEHSGTITRYPNPNIVTFLRELVMRLWPEILKPFAELTI